VTNGLDLDMAKRQIADGHRWWVYNGHRPYAGTEITDAPAIDPRVTPWACWKHDVGLWFYWQIGKWGKLVNRQRTMTNLWVDPITYIKDKGTGDYVNGDGVMVYPGQDILFPDEDRGIAGPIASIRLKNIRRGVQDYEYLWLAENNGLGTLATEIANRCVPRVFSEARGNVSWSTSGSFWDEQRQILAHALEERLGQTSPQEGD